MFKEVAAGAQPSLSVFGVSMIRVSALSSGLGSEGQGTKWGGGLLDVVTLAHWGAVSLLPRIISLEIRILLSHSGRKLYNCPG